MADEPRRSSRASHAPKRYGDTADADTVANAIGKTEDTSTKPQRPSKLAKTRTKKSSAVGKAKVSNTSSEYAHNLVDLIEKHRNLTKCISIGHEWNSLYGKNSTRPKKSRKTPAKKHLAKKSLQTSVSKPFNSLTTSTPPGLASVAAFVLFPHYPPKSRSSTSPLLSLNLSSFFPPKFY